MSEFSLSLGYIGPGLGAGTIVVILAVVASIFFAFCAIVWYPLKRTFRRITHRSPASEIDTSTESRMEPENNESDPPSNDDDGSVLAAE
jgi:hypothetical protein